MAASLPIPIPAAPRTKFIILNGFEYLAFESRLSPERVVGLPLRQLQSGQREAFIDPEVPIVTVNLAAPAIRIPDTTGLFHRVVPYTAMLGQEGTSILIAPVEEQTHRHGFYAVPQGSLVNRPPATALPPTIITPLSGFTIDTSEQYMPGENRTVRVSWSPEVAAEMSRERIYELLSSHDMVESISKGGHLEARVTLRSPYAIGSILGGAEIVEYQFWDGRLLELLVMSDCMDVQPPPQEPHRTLLINFDDPLHYAELHNFFNRFGVVNNVEPEENHVGQPRAAVVLFENPESVTNTLRGAQVLTLYHGEAEIRVRPYPTV